MSNLTSTLADQKPAARPALQARSRRRLEQPYPLFGFRRQVYRVPLADRLEEIHDWLLRQDRRQPSEPWPDRYQRCQQEQRGWFKELWEVFLPRPSRSLERGSYVFDPLTDFLHIPGSPPPVVQDCYQQAFAELPRHRFVYLDLLWEPAPRGWELVSPTRLQAHLARQERQLQQQVRHDRLLIAAAQARQIQMLQRLQPGRASEIPLPTTPAEARRVLGLSSAALERSLRAQLGMIELAKYDPVIVFEEPALAVRSGGYMPLGLLAHWD